MFSLKNSPAKELSLSSPSFSILHNVWGIGCRKCKQVPFHTFGQTPGNCSCRMHSHYREYSARLRWCRRLAWVCRRHEVVQKVCCSLSLLSFLVIIFVVICMQKSLYILKLNNAGSHVSVQSSITSILHTWANGVKCLFSAQLSETFESTAYRQDQLNITHGLYKRADNMESKCSNRSDQKFWPNVQRSWFSIPAA